MLKSAIISTCQHLRNSSWRTFKFMGFQFPGLSKQWVILQKIIGRMDWNSVYSKIHIFRGFFWYELVSLFNIYVHSLSCLSFFYSLWLLPTLMRLHSLSFSQNHNLLLLHTFFFKKNLFLSIWLYHLTQTVASDNAIILYCLDRQETKATERFFFVFFCFFK